MARPHVSICIPAYQAAQHLAETLASVVAQPAADLEILVLDNASTDGTGDIARHFGDPRIRVERNESVLSLPENWNRVVELSRGELIKIVCADDLIHPQVIERQAAVLDDDPGVALVAGRRHLITDGGQLIAADTSLRHLVGRFDFVDVARHVVRSGGNPIGESGGVMFRRKQFDAVGGFDGRLLFPMDLDLYVKILAFGDFVGVRDTVAAFRAGRGGLSAQRSRHQYLEQRELTGQIAVNPLLHVRWIDRVIGRLGAPLARWRRDILFAAADRNRPLPLLRVGSDDVAWLKPLAASTGRPASAGL